MKILEKCILLVLIYDSQTWTLTRRQAQKLLTTQRAMERNITGIKIRDKVGNVKVNRLTRSNGVGT